MLLLKNAVIATMDPARPLAEAAVVDGDYFAYVGDGDSAEDFVRRCARGPWETEDLQGGFLMPGFHDSHMHFLHYVKSKNAVDLTGTASLAELGDRLRAGLARFDGSWGRAGTRSASPARSASPPAGTWTPSPPHIR